MAARPKPQVLIIGLDGVGLDLLADLRARGASLPHLSRLMARGASGPLRSTSPPMTLPAWTTFMTGAAPSSHGVVDFTMRKGYRVVPAPIRTIYEEGNPTSHFHKIRDSFRIYRRFLKLVLRRHPGD